MGITRIPEVKSAYDIISPPTALTKEINYSAYSGRNLPMYADDGTTILLPANNAGNLEKYTAAGAQAWTVAHTDINANCDKWTGVFWHDTVDSAIWVWAYDEGTAPDTYYLAKVAWATGAVTNVGTCQPGDGLFADNRHYYYTERTAMGSGNLTIRDGDYKIILNSVTGGIDTAAAQVTQNGHAIGTGESYETADGSIYLSGFPTLDADNLPVGSIRRGGAKGNIRLTEACPHVSTNPWVTLWGDFVAISSGTTGTVYGPRFFNRIAFDLWLNDLADFLGLPT